MRPLTAQCADLGFVEGLDRDGRCRRMSVPKAKGAADRLRRAAALRLRAGALRAGSCPRCVFARAAGAYPACLLLANQNAMSDGVQYKTVSARGFTAVLRPHLAEDALPGRLLLTGCSTWPPAAGLWWADAQTGTLLYDKAQPAPELSVLCWTPPTTAGPRTRPPLYEDMKAVERLRIRPALRLHSSFLPRRTAVQCRLPR